MYLICKAMAERLIYLISVKCSVLRNFTAAGLCKGCLVILVIITSPIRASGR